MCYAPSYHFFFFFFFFNATATTEIYTLSLHDALPICRSAGPVARRRPDRQDADPARKRQRLIVEPSDGCDQRDRKSTRLNSSHPSISYAVFCLKKKKKKTKTKRPNTKKDKQIDHRQHI